MEAAVSRIVEAASEERGGYVCVTGVHGIMESQRDESLRRIHNASLLTTPDGMPTVWVGRLRGHGAMRRVYGPSLMLEVCRRSVANQHSHYLFGGGDGVVDLLQDALERKFAGIRVVGKHTPPFRPLNEEEEHRLLQSLMELRPQYCWVGLSTPKQERFAARMAQMVPSTVFLCVGAAFDMNAGLLRQAPAIMQSMGLEWLFRLAVEPRRLWRRYLRNNPAFMARIAWNAATRWRYLRPLD
ncbi:MAG: WecB/TagA/CpsF family glycosyltransferase [Gemmatimonadales bacterium]